MQSLPPPTNTSKIHLQVEQFSLETNETGIKTLTQPKL